MVCCGDATPLRVVARCYSHVADSVALPYLLATRGHELSTDLKYELQLAARRLVVGVVAWPFFFFFLCHW